MTTLREAAQHALETLEMAEFDPHSSDAVHKAITALKAALAEPVPTCRRAICQRGPDGYCAPCHERMYP